MGRENSVTLETGGFTTKGRGTVPDSETFKLIVQGGSFALIVLGFVWLLFKAEPGYRSTVEKMASDHKEAIDKQSDAHVKKMETVCATFAAALAKQFDECREERRELVDKFQETIGREFELNRTAQQGAVERIDRAINEHRTRGQ